MTNTYTELQVKTSYSILNSLNDIKKLVARANEYGYQALAISDEGNMFGVIEFYLECNKYNIKPIIGIEFKIDGSIILLYAKNNDGYRNLIKLATISSDKDINIDDLKRYKDNLILIMEYDSYNQEIYDIYDDKFMGYNDITYRDKIGSNRVYISNVSYLDKMDYRYLDYANMIRDGKIIGEYELNTKKGRHLKRIEELDKILDYTDKSNMEYIIDSCNVTLGYTEGLLPIYDKDIDSKIFLHDMAFKGLDRRLKGNVTKKYQDRLNYELDIIDKMGFNDYFLIVYDYVLYAKKNGILVGPGRGSAAGSLVSYTLGITDIDPLKYNLLFERFLNPERVTMPDIDIDFDAVKRQDVIDYVINKYGSKKVVGIITFNTLGAKQAIRDVGRVLNLNLGLIDTLAKSCNDDLVSSYKNSSKFKKLVDSSIDLKKVIEIAIHLEGLPRHVSVHAAGVVMSSKDISDVIPLFKNQLGYYVSSYSKDYLEGLGLLKMDFLGISNLTLIDEIINNIRKDTGLNITFQNIPDEDKQTFELFSRGDTEGIFQFEAPGMIKFLKDLKPNKFSDIVAATSLYRPGPMDSIPEYLKGRRNPDKIEYIHKDLEDILKETYGIIIYQEQIMQIATKLSGYTLGEADMLRRAISKKKEAILLEEKDKFVKGAIKNGYKEELANKVYDLILKFANYGFNKSHAVAYAMIAYRMAFLKTHFYGYFMLSLLSNVVNNPEKSSIYISKLRQHNIKILSPDINLSKNNYYINNKMIIAPLSIIKNVSGVIVNTIINERSKGEYKSFIDFVKRNYSKQVNRKVIESLILAGVFDRFDINKKSLMYSLDIVINYAEIAHDSGLIEVEEPVIDIVDDYSKEEKINYEMESFGFYLSNHPVTKYKDNKVINTLELENYLGKYIYINLMVLKVKEIVTKKNDVMAFIDGEDEFTDISVTLFPNIYKENNYLKKYDIINIYGKVEKRNDICQIVASKITKLN